MRPEIDGKRAMQLAFATWPRLEVAMKRGWAPKCCKCPGDFPVTHGLWFSKRLNGYVCPPCLEAEVEELQAMIPPRPSTGEVDRLIWLMKPVLEKPFTLTED